MIRKLLFAVIFCLPVVAFAKSPKETLQASQTKLDSALSIAPEKGSAEAKKRRATLEAEAKKLFDFETLSQKVLGKNWDTGNTEQQQEFVSLFSYLVRDKYLDQIEGNSAKGFTLSWGNEELSGDTAVVRATFDGKTAEGKEVHIKIVYKMIQRSSGWMVYDVVTDDSSLMETYKDSFGKMFKKEGSFEAVLVKLRGKAGVKAPAAETPKAQTETQESSGVAAPTFVAPKPPVKPAPKVEPKAEPKVEPKAETKVEPLKKPSAKEVKAATEALRTLSTSFSGWFASYKSFAHEGFFARFFSGFSVLRFFKLA